MQSVEGALNEEEEEQEVRCLYNLRFYVPVHMLAWSSRLPGRTQRARRPRRLRSFAFSASSSACSEPVVCISRGDSVIVMKKTLNLKRRYNLFRSFLLSLSPCGGRRSHTLSRGFVGSNELSNRPGRRSGTRRKQEKWQHIYETIGPRNH